MDKYRFRVVVSSFIFDMRNMRGFGYHSQSELARGLGVRDATVSSWVNKESCISAFTLFRLFSYFASVNRISLVDVVSRFLDRYSSMIEKE